MAGFSLGGGSGCGGSQIPTDSLFLYTSGGAGGHSGSDRQAEEITTYGTKGFELWQQQQHQLQQQRHQHHHHLYASGVGMMLDDDPAGSGGSGGRSGRGTRAGSRGGPGMSCQDCGNQAKKDCMHMRCRTCCKSRGNQCSTHVKSTWVSAAKRRERQQQLAAAMPQQQPQIVVRGGEQPKRPRGMGGNSLACTRLPATVTITTTSTTSGGLEAAASFPPEVNSPALFRCVRMSGVEDADDQYAYQTAVSIAGHVFKGVLYDHGPDSSHYSTTHLGDASSSSAVVSGRAVTTAGATITTSAAMAAAAMNMDPATLYPTPLSAFMAGTQFFPQPRP